MRSESKTETFKMISFIILSFLMVGGTLAEIVGDSCTTNLQCETALGQLGLCGNSSKICGCSAEGISSADKKRCLPLVKEIAGQCEESQQCKKGTPGERSDCLEGTCQCIEGASQSPGDDFCSMNADRVGAPCGRPDECVANLGKWSDCVGGAMGYCDCIAIAVASLDQKTCLPHRKHSEPCEESQQCQKGSSGDYSFCRDKICQCTLDAILSGQVCYKKAAFVGDECDPLVNVQCQPNLGHSTCDPVTSKCMCETGYVPSVNNGQCVESVNIGDLCNDHAQCGDTALIRCLPDGPLPGIDRRCACIEGYTSDPDHQAGNVCFKMAEKVGDSCSDHQFQCTSLEGAECIIQSDITKAYCLCDASTEVTSLDGRRCLTARDRLNEPCDETAQCRPLNSVCARSTGDAQLRCICASDFVEFDQPSRCLKVAMELGQPCQEDIQCSTYLGDLTECRLGRCDCSHRALPYNGRCFVKASLGAYCQAYEECHLGASNYSYCDVRDSRCKCLTDAIEWNQLCWGDKQIGDVCSRNEECDVSIDGPTLCQGMRCACSPGYEADDVTNKVCVSEGSFMSIPITLLMVTTLLSYFK